MLKKIAKIWEKWSKEGMNLPYAHDPVQKQASVTLLSFYIMLLLAVLSLVALHLKVELLAATSMTLLAWAMSFVFYKLRRLDRAKIDLDDKSIELDGDDEEEENKDE